MARSLEHARQVDAGEDVDPLCGVGFETMTQFGAVFTPKRWELVEFLKTAGPMTIYALAKRLSRHYRNVHKDVTALIEWMVIEKDESGKVFVPWDEIDVRWPLVKQAA
ncbi:MAG: HTH domain-containing protein [Betaproteobacteria bacterium]|nr:HTH domain-containing protein [Betaproteobacteria bacterium]